LPSAVIFPNNSQVLMLFDRAVVGILFLGLQYSFYPASVVT